MDFFEKGMDLLKKGAKSLISKLLSRKVKLYLTIAAVVVCTVVIIVAAAVGAFASGAGGGGGGGLTQGMGTASQDAWEQFIKYLHQCESGGTIYKNAEGVDCYKVNSDGGGGSAVGYGVDIATHGARLRAAGYDTSIGSLIPVTVVDPIEKEEREARYADVEALETANGISLTVYQKFALTSRTYNYGLDGGTEQNSKFKYPSNLTFVQAYKQYYNSSDNYYGDYSKTDFSHQLYTQYMTALHYASGGQPDGWVTRRKSECLFQTGYFGWGLKNGNAYPIGFDEYCMVSMATGEPGKTGAIDIRGITVKTYTASNGNTYVLYDQTKGPWSSVSYADSTIGAIGCPTTAGATILSGLGYNIYPDDLTSMYSTGVFNVLANKGATTNKVECNISGKITETHKNAIIGYLQSGKPVLIHVYGSGKGGSNQFAKTQHWMALLDTNADGSKVFLACGATGEPAWYETEVALQSLQTYGPVYK